MDDQKSPVPISSPKVESEILPGCPHCFGPVTKVKYLDYGNVRVVFHDAPQLCALGVMKAE